MRQQCFCCLCLFPFIYAECTSCHNDGEDSGKSPSPHSHSSGPWGLSQGPFHGQLGQVAIGISQPLTLGLSWPSFPGRGAGERSWAEGLLSLPLPPQRLIGHRLPGAAPPWPLKGALYHYKEALSLLKNPGHCHGDRGGKGGSPCVGRKGHSRQRALVRPGRCPVWVMAVMPSCDPRLD